MLFLDRPLQIAGVPLYADHHDPATFHLLPGSPVVLLQDGRPSLRLQIFRGGANGGLLWLDVVLRHSPAELDAAREELARTIAPNAHLVPVLFDAGSVRLSILQSGSAPAETPKPRFLVEKVLASAAPSLTGDHRAIFSVRLDPEGAVLLEQSLKDGILPATIVYDLEFRGLQPAMGLRARLQNRLAYDYFRARLAADSLWFRADLSRETEALQKQGILTIEDVDFSGRPAPDPAARRDQIHRELREWIELMYFRPSVSPALPASAPAAPADVRAAWSDSGFARGAFVLRALKQEEEQDLVYDRSVISVNRARIAPQGLLQLPQGSDPAELIQHIELESTNSPRSVYGYVPRGADWTGVTSFTLDVRSGVEIQSAVFDSTHAEHRLTLPAGNIDYRVKAQFTEEAEALGTPPEQSDVFRPCPSEYLSLDPSVISGRRVVNVVGLNLGAADIAAFSGKIESLGKQRAVQLTPAKPETKVPVWNGGPLRITGHFRPGSGAIPWERTFPASESTLLVPAPGSFRSVTIHLNDPLERHANVLVEIGPASGSSSKSFLLDANHTAATWSAAATPGTEAAYRYRVRRVLKDASVEEGSWTPGDGSLLVVGDTNVRVDVIDIVWLGPELLGGLLRLVSLKPPSNTSPDVELMFDGSPASLQAKVPFAPDAERRYTIQGQLFTETDTIDLPPREESAEVLLLSPR
jgi:hypothetical protein